MYYLYYKIYRFWLSLSFGLGKMQYRTAATIALLILSNVISLLKILNVKFVFKNKYIFVLIVIIWVLINMQFFGRKSMHEWIMEKYKNENDVKAIIGGALAALYVVISFGIFIYAMKL